MAENSKIAWTTHTYNHWIGCSRSSPGCENCYAENLMDHRYHRVEWGPGKPRSRTKTFKDPYRWNQEAAEEQEHFRRSGLDEYGYEAWRPRVFCSSLSDYLDDEVQEDWRTSLFRIIEDCSNMDWLLLTKRIENAKVMLPRSWLTNPLPHVWYGVTGESQKWYDRRVKILGELPAAIRFVSYEPALGPLTLGTNPNIHWIITGGESNQTSPARRFDLEWIETLDKECQAVGIAHFVKQLGSNPWHRGKALSLRDKAGADPQEWPEHLRVRQFPSRSSVGEQVGEVFQ